jgi:hypothetical protein
MKLTEKIATLALVGLMIGISFSMWSESSDWSDTGHINWVGQLTPQHYQNNSLFYSQNITFFLLPYSVLTTSHGTFNFTIDVHVDALMTYIPLNGTSVGVTHDRDGITFIVFKQ